MKQKSVMIKLDHGLEARPVAMLVQVASRHNSTVYLEAEGKKVNAKSIMGMMSLGLDNGEMVNVIADGSDEEEAIFNIEEYLSGNHQAAVQ
ncbi:MAG: HPr family phosphocarrier protein [Lachnospiraceae bacterium]|nr:HPr family phosphocarrier protein [Lachnospiraceae bacterium]